MELDALRKEYEARPETSKSEHDAAIKALEGQKEQIESLGREVKTLKLQRDMHKAGYDLLSKQLKAVRGRPK